MEDERDESMQAPILLSKENYAVLSESFHQSLNVFELDGIIVGGVNLQQKPRKGKNENSKTSTSNGKSENDDDDDDDADDNTSQSSSSMIEEDRSFWFEYNDSKGQHCSSSSVGASGSNHRQFLMNSFLSKSHRTYSRNSELTDYSDDDNDWFLEEEEDIEKDGESTMYNTANSELNETIDTLSSSKQDENGGDLSPLSSDESFVSCFSNTEEMKRSNTTKVNTKESDANDDGNKVEVVTQVYEGAKQLWGFGKDHLGIFGMAFGATEFVVNVASKTIGFQSQNDLEQTILIPRLQAVDHCVVSPVYNFLSNILAGNNNNKTKKMLTESLPTPSPPAALPLKRAVSFDGEKFLKEDNQDDWIPLEWIPLEPPSL